MKAPLSLLIVAACFAAPALAGPGVGVKLGETDLRDAKDWDVVPLPACSASSNIPVTSLGIRVTRHAAQIDSLKVVYHNGTTERVNVRHRFAPGSTSRWVDLRGEARCIKSIRIVGDTDSLGWRPGKQAHVAFFGKATPGGGAGAVVASGGAVGTRLGARRLTDRKDWDLVRLPACRGSNNVPVTHVKIRVNDYPAQIDRLVVTFHNGGRQEVNVRKRFGADTESIWHDLNGPARCIQSVRVVGDTNSLGWRPGKQAEVVFWGKVER